MLDWIYIRNPFLKQNISLFNQRASGRYTLDMLQSESSDPDLLVLHTKLEPYVTTFEGKFTTHLDGKDVAIGATQAFYNKMTEVRKQSRKWEQKIVLVFDVDTPEYKSFFPAGRSALYQGKIAERLDKILGLHNKLAAYPALNTVTEAVETFYQELTDLQTAKIGQYNGNTGISIELQKAAVDLAVAMFSTYGSLVAKYALTPKRIEHFLLMSVLRSKPTEDEEENNTYSLIIPVTGMAIANLSFSVDDKFNVSNIGEESVFCYGAVNPNDPEPATLIEIPSGADVEVTAIMLGAPEAKYMIFVNRSALAEGEVEITML